MRIALAFLAAAVLATGCHKNTGENPEAPVDNPKVRDAGEAPPPAQATLSGPLTEGDGGTHGQSGPDTSAAEACVDRWLQAHKLDRYGNAEGTMYAGGTPLFNEATGETRDRLEYVFSRQPEARKACLNAGAQ